jgi:thiosulfate/3-mercaptopyruvate sulfurtransferase
MRALLRPVVRIFVVSFLVVLASSSTAAGADRFDGNLVDVRWLEKNLGRSDLLILDASAAQTYAKQHIPGAVAVDIFSYGAEEAPMPAMEQRIRSWGVSPGKTIVAYDPGGTYLATRLFFTLAYYGFPVKRIAVLDGGLSKWLAEGLPVSSEPVVATPGSFTVAAPDESVRVRLPEFLTASGDPERYALVEALGPDWHYGQVAPFGRPGHVPNSVLMPSPDFFNADKTFKSPAELRTMLSYHGVSPEQEVLTYCGGGISASAPFFAIRYILGYPDVKMFVESELGWLQDERELPFWTYDAPYLMRETPWLSGWGGRMMRMYGVSKISVVDVRPKAAFDEGHLPFALNVPAGVFRSHLSSPGALAPLLGAAGVDPSHEAVVVSGAGLTKEAALAFLMLETLGQNKVSIFIDSMEKAAAAGLAPTTEPTVVGPKKGPGDPSIVPAAYPAGLRSGLIISDPESTKGIYPKVFIASGPAVPSCAPEGSVHIPSTDLLEDGRPKAAKEIWSILSKAGVPRYAELVCISEDPAEAAANYYVLRLMGWPDVKVMTGDPALHAMSGGV